MQLTVSNLSFVAVGAIAGGLPVRLRRQNNVCDSGFWWRGGKVPALTSKDVSLCSLGLFECVRPVRLATTTHESGGVPASLAEVAVCLLGSMPFRDLV